MISYCVGIWALIFIFTPSIMGAVSDDQLYILDLVDCPYQVEPIGCFADRSGWNDRALPHQILNSRDIFNHVFQGPKIQWKNYKHWVSNFLCECAKLLFKQKDVRSEYIGLQFYGECWSNLNRHKPSTYKRHGKSDKCINHTYGLLKGEPSRCGLYIGPSLTNFVYKVSKLSSSCLEIAGKYTSPSYSVGTLSISVDGAFFKGVSETDNRVQLTGQLAKGCKGHGFFMDDNKQDVEYNLNSCQLTIGRTTFIKKKCDKDDISCPHFVSRGCWNDPFPRKKPEERPMNVYAMNERDPYADNWNGRFIDWKNWGSSYLASLVCRCAKLAKKTHKKFFSIQFYGECWTSNKTDFDNYGNVTRCVDTEWDQCPRTGNKCRDPLCAGQWQANKVYEIIEDSPE